MNNQAQDRNFVLFAECDDKELRQYSARVLKGECSIYCLVDDPLFAFPFRSDRHKWPPEIKEFQLASSIWYFRDSFHECPPGIYEADALLAWTNLQGFVLAPGYYPLRSDSESQLGFDTNFVATKLAKGINPFGHYSKPGYRHEIPELLVDSEWRFIVSFEQEWWPTPEADEILKLLKRQKHWPELSISSEDIRHLWPNSNHTQFVIRLDHKPAKLRLAFGGAVVTETIQQKGAKARKEKYAELERHAVSLWQAGKFRSKLEASNKLLPLVNKYARSNNLIPLTEYSGSNTIYKWLRRS